MPDPMDLSDKQWASIRDSVGVVNVWEGAIRSGKTIGSLFRWLMFVRQAPDSGRLMMIGKTRDSLAANTLAPMMDYALFGELSLQVRYTPGANFARILGRTVEIVGAHDAQAETKLRGRTVVGAYVDEVTTLQEGFFRQLRGRMSMPGSQLFCTTNPDATTHWFKKKYLDQEPSGWRRFHFTMDDNPSLEESFKAQMRRENVGLWHRRFILGEWVNADGAVYDMWDDKRHVIPHAELPDMHRLLAVGVDFGSTNASSAILLGLGIDRCLYFIDEWRHDPEIAHKKLTVGEQAKHISAWLRNLRSEYPLRPEWIFVDPASDQLQVQLEYDGHTNVDHANNDVLYGIQLTATLLAAGKLFVSDRCQGLISEFPSYAWDDKATIEGKDKPKKVDDHSIDASRYALATTETQWRRDVFLASAA